MTLSVGLYQEAADGRYEYVPYDPKPPRNDAAGAERWRTSFYGSDRARQLGLELLPGLADGNLFVKGPDLLRLAREVQLLKEDHQRLVEVLEQRGSEYTRQDDFTVYCLENIEHAIRTALDSGGLVGVCIE